MLSLLSASPTMLSRRTLLWLIAVAVLIGAIPTVCLVPALAQETQAQVAEKTRAQRIEELQKRVDALQKELAALRAERSGQDSVRFWKVAPNQNLNPWFQFNDASFMNPQPQWHNTRLFWPANQANLIFDTATLFRPADQEVSLSRKTYQLPKARAEALAAFLREHSKAQVMETNLEGDQLTITTTPEVQKSISQLIAAFQKEAAK